MKETNKMIETRLLRTIESMVPDLLPQLLKHVKEEGDREEMSDTIIAMKDMNNTKTKKFTNKTVGAVAAGFLLLIGVYSGYMHYSPQSVINFDVNPSIEMSLNRSEKILKVVPLNEEGRIVIGDMNFRNVDLDLGINALIGSMVKNGYIDEIKNSILVTVDSSNIEKRTKLQEHISDEVSKLLETYKCNGSVLSQIAKTDEHIRELAKEYNISAGKASLIDKFVKNNPSISYSDAASMPINDINVLIETNKFRLEGLNTTGKAGDGKYIGSKKAIALALKNAGVSEKDLGKMEVEMDYEDGRMIYEIEFYVGNKKYDYEIDAESGRMLKSKIKDKTVAGSEKMSNLHKDNQASPRPSGEKSNYIDSKKALEIALNHAGTTESRVAEIEIKLKKEDDIMIYEIEFIYKGMEYEYEIDAVTGRIAEFEIEPEDD